MAYIGQGIKQGTFKVLDTSGNTYNGSNGQALTTNGSGTLSFSTISTGLTGIDDQSSSNDDQLTITDTAVVINEDSDDVDFRVESNGNANMLFVSGGNDVVGIGAEGDLGVGLHIKTADTSGSVSGDADELVIEGTGHNGMTILSGTSHEGRINFGDSGGSNRGFFSYDHSADAAFIGTGGNNVRVKVDTDGKIATGGETAPDVDAGGITIDNNANDGFSLTFKNSDVAHATTGEAEADTFMRMAKYTDDGGGAIVGYSENLTGIYIQGHSANPDTSKGGSSGSNIILKATKNSGTGGTSHGSNENLATIANHNNPKFIFDAEGDFHADSSSTTFDAYDDAQLVRAYDLSHGKGVINSKFDKFVAYNHEKLAELRLVGREDDGMPNHFVNITGMQRLHNGAIWQQYEKHNQLLEAVYDLAKEAVGEEKANAILEKHEVKRLQ